MSTKMSMMFSQNGGTVGKIMRKVAPESVPAPTTAPVQQQAKSRSVVGLNVNARSAPRGVKQLFNLGHIMANPGTPCKACGS